MLFVLLSTIVIIFIIIKRSSYNLEQEKKLKIALFKLTHEIKNPLTVCKGYIDMINNSDKENIDNYLNIIKSELDRTVMIINEFSDYGKLKLNKDIVEVSLLFEEVFKTINPIVQNKNIKVKLNNLEDEIYLNIDYLKIKQVLINILKNAIEAKKKDEDMILITDIKVEKNTLKIQIKDTGIGMTKETLSKISDIFYTTKQNGTGLGVGLSKEIIKLHNGTIDYKSTFGKGTSVLIKLPIK